MAAAARASEMAKAAPAADGGAMDSFDEGWSRLSSKGGSIGPRRRVAVLPYYQYITRKITLNLL